MVLHAWEKYACYKVSFLKEREKNDKQKWDINQERKKRECDHKDKKKREKENVSMQ